MKEKNSNTIVTGKYIPLLMLCMSSFFIGNSQYEGQTKKSKTTAAIHTGIYPDFFQPAAYSEADIDARVDKVHHELFEGSNAKS